MDGNASQGSRNRKSREDGTWGEAMQEAAVQGDSLNLVAGASLVVEKKRPGFVIDFTWRIDAAKANRPRATVFDVSRCAA